jgi:ATP-dependent Lhr-like helicase
MELLSLAPSSETALGAVAEPLRCWFRARIGEPTAAQRLAWPAIVSGRHLLLAAPTGSGKTLAAFLPIVDQLLSRTVSRGVRCLYVTPLKALVSDVRKNLRRHLRNLREFLPSDTFLPQVEPRTGDTDPKRRRAQLLDPPDVLLTTPESLALMLSQPGAAELFADLRWVVVDEVHALAGNKRGADLSLSLERLHALAGQGGGAGHPAGGDSAQRGLQRIGLSATCAPLEQGLHFLIGVGREGVIAAAPEQTALELHLEPLPESGRFLAELVERLGSDLTRNRGTLIFANTRGLAERLSWALRHRYPDWDGQIAVHHSALAPERRRRIEHRFKRGRLRAVVSSPSLELGIDIGAVDGVVLVHPPGGVVRLLQRVGRSGHGPGRVRRGVVLTASPTDLLEAAATAAAGRSGQCEPLTVPAHPLDVLCQQLLGLAASGAWTADDAFALIRRAHAYRDLPRGDFDACLAYLSGHRSLDGRQGEPWLPPRLRWAAGAETLGGTRPHPSNDTFLLRDARTAKIVRRNLGTILADEPRLVCLESDDPLSVEMERRRIGQVAEAFAERLQPGERFLLDGRCLEFRRHDGEMVLVHDVPGRPALPRWGGEGIPLSPELARRLYLLRQRAAEALRQAPENFAELLRDDYQLTRPAVASLLSHFQRQECCSEVPGDGLLIEAVAHTVGGDYYLHTPLNQAGNDAVARVVVLRLQRDMGRSASTLVAQLGLCVRLRGGGELSPEAWRSLLATQRFDTDLDEALADSVVLRERFRRVALTGLMLLRQPLGRKRRVGGADWPERRLFDQVQHADPDFVLLRQARREVRQDCCDAVQARLFLEEVPRRLLRLRWLLQPSPFVEGWSEVVSGPTATADDPAAALRRLHEALTGRPEDAHPSGLAADA